MASEAVCASMSAGLQAGAACLDNSEVAAFRRETCLGLRRRSYLVFSAFFSALKACYCPAWMSDDVCTCAWHVMYWAVVLNLEFEVPQPKGLRGLSFGSAAALLSRSGQAFLE